MRGIFRVKKKNASAPGAHQIRGGKTISNECSTCGEKTASTRQTGYWNSPTVPAMRSFPRKSKKSVTLSRTATLRAGKQPRMSSYFGKEQTGFDSRPMQARQILRSCESFRAFRNSGRGNWNNLRQNMCNCSETNVQKNIFMLVLHVIQRIYWRNTDFTRTVNGSALFGVL